jgi:hypothetical protein
MSGLPAAALNLLRKQQRRLLARTRRLAKVGGDLARDAAHAVRRGTDQAGLAARRGLRVVRRRLRQVTGRVRRFARDLKDPVHVMVRAGRRSRKRVHEAVARMRKAVRQAVRRPLRRHLRRRKLLREQLEFNKIGWRVDRELERAVDRGRLLVLGPWLSEVGFETLYWVPFLHWVKAAFNLEPDRLIAVSRGGVSGWYAGLASRYVEIWDDMDPAEFGRRNAERGITKQWEFSELDKAILDNVAQRIGTREFDVVHPSAMYRLFSLYWSGQRAMGFMDAYTRFSMMEAPSIIDPALLPADYVAVKFYAARSLPDTPEVRRSLDGILSSIAEHHAIVMLDTGLVLDDDHSDYPLSAGRRVISARPWMTPRNNLGVQTQIIAGAKAFAGTCGSIAWLAPRLGIDTSALYVDPKWLHAHLGFAMRAYYKLTGAGRFAPADLRAFEPWDPRAQAESASRVDALT